MVTLFRIDGVIYLIYTRGHRPPHVHVKPSPITPEWELRIYLGRRQDGQQDECGKIFGDTEAVFGQVRVSKIQEYVDVLAQNIEQVWIIWDSIYGDSP